MANVMNEKEKNVQEEPRLDVTPADFKPVAERTVMNSKELCEKVYTLMKGISSEFTGCNLIVEGGPRGPRYALLAYFTPATKVNGQFQVVKDVISSIDQPTKAMNTLTKIGTVQMNKRYELTDDAKTVFKPMMFTNDKNEVNWKTDVTENADSAVVAGTGGIRQSVARVCVKFDMIKLLGVIYGDENSSGGKYEYIIVATGEMPTLGQNLGTTGLVNPAVAGPRNLILSIERFDRSRIFDKANAWGLGNQYAEQTSIPMFRFGNK